MEDKRELKIHVKSYYFQEIFFIIPSSEGILYPSEPYIIRSKAV
jgi:hypothetical protein